mgnify:CR=1 FL=1
MTLNDTVGAFIPGERHQVAPLAAGRLSGLTFAVKDLFDVAGAVTTYGNPDWAASHGVSRVTAPITGRPSPGTGRSACQSSGCTICPSGQTRASSP